MLKKQTVWLLTMLSLMIVLSAYYLMSDKEDFAYVETEQEVSQENKDNEENSEVEIDEVTEVENDDILTMIRMEMDDERSMKKDRLKEIVASSNATTTEINEALDEIDTLDSLSSKERILQESLMANNDTFEDVLVRADNDKVHVDIIADNIEKEEAAKIMREVQDEIGSIPVDVKYRGKTD
ncbi:MAG TPA: SpoIIIAH-like family protein [Pseudogracilibacillus sp.]|nr:SpoIIIAH-like family protein [Pseudogracilibacillus sp.]